MLRTTPERITVIDSNEIFVFGSNLAGRHAGGAAFDAANRFGAVEGVGEGLTGECYAFPTLKGDLSKIEYDDMICIADTFYRCVDAHPELTFLLTRVGTGIAGHSAKDMKNLFIRKRDNLVLPEGW
jgi:hypothetical protein